MVEYQMEEYGTGVDYHKLLKMIIVLPYEIKKVPYVFVGDDAFAWKKNMMKPYPQHGLTEDKRVYNYRHSRARRLSENLFGILANRWRVFRSALLLPPDSVELIVFTALVLHNYLWQSLSIGTYCPKGLIDRDQDGQVVPGTWRQESSAEAFTPLLVPPIGHNASTDAKSVRETLKDYGNKIAIYDKNFILRTTNSFPLKIDLQQQLMVQIH